MSPGDVFAGRFEIEARVGSGGMGEVFRARDRESGERVALKVLVRLHDRGRRRFAREARVLSELRHPAIVRHLAHGVGEDDRPYMAMEWLEGEDLEARLGPGPLSLDEVMVLLVRLADALGAVHERGVVHRDVKPANVFLEGGAVDRAKLLDFGIARVTGPPVTTAGTILGTPEYMAPEQARAEGELSPRADVFALGALIFRCLAGRSPFAGPDSAATLARVVFEPAPRLSEVCHDVPERLDALVARMLAKDEGERPEDGTAVAALAREIVSTPAALPAWWEKTVEVRRTLGEAPAAVGSWIGRPIGGKYVVEGVIGRGGMGIVLRARHGVTGALVAVKVLHGNVPADHDHAQRLLAEARAAAAIRHPGIVGVTDAGTSPDGQPYVAMELLSGRPLSRRIDEGRVPFSECRRVALEALDALAAAHDAGFIHRDLKPDNIFLAGPAGSVKLLDFGLVKASGDEGGHTASGAVMGSLAYMSPEQIRSSKDVDVRTDLWAMGVVIYEMLTCALPYDAHGFGDMLLQMLARPAAPLSEQLTGVPGELDEFVARALSVDPGARFASAREMAEALRALPTAELGERGGLAPREGTRGSSGQGPGALDPVTFPTGSRRMHGRWIGAAVLAAAVTVAGARALSVSQRSPRTSDSSPGADTSICARLCDKLVTCGGYADDSCVSDCLGLPVLRACAEASLDDCNALALCEYQQYAARRCPAGSGVPRGTASCKSALNCQGECNATRAPASCLCDCVAEIAPAKAGYLFLENNCSVMKCPAECSSKGNGPDCSSCAGLACSAEVSACLAN